MKYFFQTISWNTFYGHDKMILCLVIAHVSIFNPWCQAFLWSLEAFFVSFVSFCKQTFSQLSVWLSFIINTNLKLEVHSFKSLQYTCECSNWYKVRILKKLWIFLIFMTLNLHAYGHFIGKKSARMNIFKENKTYCAWRF